MMTGSKRWWRAVALAAIGGGAIGAWFGFVQPRSAKSDQSTDETTWTRAPTTLPPPPVVAEVRGTPEAALPTGDVTPVGGVLPIPVPSASGPVDQAMPATPPVLVPAAPLPVPPAPLPTIEPVLGPRVPDAGLISADKVPLPPVPPLPPAELPPPPTPPKTPEVKPVLPAADVAPIVPAGPSGPPPMAVPPAAPVAPMAPMTPPGAPLTATAEPPKAAPLPPPTPLAPPSGPAAPVAPLAPSLAPPAGITPSLPPLNPADPLQPMLPAKPNSDLKPSDPRNTLYPTGPVVAPAVPIIPGGTGREIPGTPVDRAKPTEPNFGSTDKFVFPLPAKPLPPDPIVPHQRDDTMLNLTTTAAFAVLGGALFAAEKAHAFPTIPSPATIPMPGGLVRADDKTEVDKLKTDLATANRKIEDLEKQVKRLNELLYGRQEGGMLVDPTAPGAVADVKKLKDDIFRLENELKTLKTQTALKPSVAAPVPEVKPRGIVKIINDYPVEITMAINEKSTYHVAPHTTLEVEVPVGVLTYQLLQSGAQPTRSEIKDKEVVKLRIK